MTRWSLAVLAAAFACPNAGARASSSLPPPVEAPAAVTTPAPDAKSASSRVAPNQIPDENCLTTTICNVKKQLKWNKSGPWSPGYCRVIARKVLDSAAKHDLPPALLLAVMINESDLNERAVNTTMKGNTVYAKDSGLMGIRCILDSRGKCVNGAVKGLAWKTVMDPLRNIEIGANELARWRDGGSIATVELRKRDKEGRVYTETKVVPCQHKTHAYWAHYNHGPRYIDHGPARHYPHRVAVLYHALAKSLNVDAPDLRSNRITINDKGLRPRTADRPVEPRYKEICAHILSAGGLCSGVASLPPAPQSAGH